MDPDSPDSHDEIIPNDEAGKKDLTANIIGAHPFSVRIFFGDDRQRAFLAGADGGSRQPGIQIVTTAAENLLINSYAISRAEFFRAAQNLGLDPRFLFNLACESNPQDYRDSLQKFARAAGKENIESQDNRALQGLKQAMDDSKSFGPSAIIRAVMAYLIQPDEGFSQPYGKLIGHVNHVLKNSGGNPRKEKVFKAISGLNEIAPEGIELWWIKEGSATLVFQVLVHLREERPSVKFAVNVAKDGTAASDELRQTYNDFLEFYRIDNSSAMEPLGGGSVEISTCRGREKTEILAAEWFSGHELHVYPRDATLHVWMDQTMNEGHPIPQDKSDHLWAEIVRIRARYTRDTPQGLLPISTHVNAGDHIVRENPNKEWQLLLIWARRPTASLPPGDYIVVTGLMPGAKVLGTDQDITVWWDKPGRSLESTRLGLSQAGLDDARILEIFKNAYAGSFAQFASEPEKMPYLASMVSGNPDKLREVFQRARNALGDFLGIASP
jgi:hypothetical protein